MKRTIYRILSLVLCLCLLPVGALADAKSYTGEVLVAMNPDLSHSSYSQGTFNPSLQPNVRDIWVDEKTGETARILDVTFPEPVLLFSTEDDEIHYSQEIAPASYEPGATISICDNDNAKRNMKCLYVGNWCTVWGCTDDNAAINLTSEHAASIGAEFDANCQKMVSAFGDWYDADGDHKLAIFCYDIGKNYPSTNFSNGYTGGFFNSGDLIDSNLKINGLKINNGVFTIGMDAIHLDTYPSMGRNPEAPFDSLSDAYSTLYHEMQHLINFSYQVADPTGQSYNALNMPTYLDEAFSMAAEHLICGESACSSRVDLFNHDPRYTTGYVDGTSLTVWSGTLSNYSNSYLFGQYLRTRYGQMLNNGTDGSTFFKAVLSGRTANDSDNLLFISNLLNTTPSQLVSDFWKAVYMKKGSGPLGFAGETWANSISPKVYKPSDYSGTFSIGNGSAMYFDISDGPYTPTNPNGLNFTTITSENKASVTISDDTVYLTVTTDTPGNAAVCFYDSVTNKFLGYQFLPLAGTECGTVLDFTETRFDLNACTWKAMILDDNYLPVCEAATSE